MLSEYYLNYLFIVRAFAENVHYPINSNYLNRKKLKSKTLFHNMGVEFRKQT